MAKLNCSVKGCCYNVDNGCCKTNIHVTGANAKNACETVCDSFLAKGCTATCSDQVTSCACACEQIEVCCDAVNCKYNQNEKCKANHIGITGVRAVTNGETECGSFECK